MLGNLILLFIPRVKNNSIGGQAIYFWKRKHDKHLYLINNEMLFLKIYTVHLYNQYVRSHAKTGSATYWLIQKARCHYSLLSQLTPVSPILIKEKKKKNKYSN